MTVHNSCPQPEVLSKLIDGALSEQLEDELVIHLDHCSACRQSMDQLSLAIEHDTECLNLHDPHSGSPFLQNAMRHAHSLRNPDASRENTAPPAASADLTHFRPTGFSQLEEIGRGGMGVVFRAFEESLDRWVAIKVLAPAFAADSSARERFFREARAAASIKAASVVAIYAVSSRLPLPYLVMELVEGQSLQQFLDDGKRFDANEIVRIARCVTDGLQAAHAKGIVHRDIKPANLLIESNSGDALVSDFGLAQVANRSRLTQTGILVGTPAYIAPELLEDGGGDARSDLFSLGCVLYAMCSGASPFDADTAVKTLHKIGTLDPQPVQSHDRSLPDWLGAIIDRLILKEPDKRFQTAQELANALHETRGRKKNAFAIDTHRLPSVRKEPLENRHGPKSHGKLFGKQLRKNRALIVGILSIVALVSLGGYWMFGDGRRASTEPDLNATFVVTESNGQSAVAFESIEQAFRKAPDGARIELRTNSKITLDPIVLNQSELTIASGKGFRPVLQFLSEESEESLLAMHGNLYLDGLDLRALWKNDSEGQPLVMVVDGQLDARNCRFESSSDGSCFFGDEIEHARFTNCKLASIDGAAVHFEPSSDGKLTMINCQIVGENAVRVPAAHDVSIELQRCTLVGHRLIELTLEDMDEDDRPAISTNASNCILVGHDSILFIESGTAELGETLDVIAWTGARNLFCGTFFQNSESSESEDELQDDSHAEIESLEQWKQQFSERESHEADQPFATELDELEEHFFDDPSNDMSRISLHQSVQRLGGVYGAKLPIWSNSQSQSE